MSFLRSVANRLLSAPCSSPAANLLLAPFTRALTGANESIFNYPRKSKNRIQRKVPVIKHAKRTTLRPEGLPSLDAFKDKKCQGFYSIGKYLFVVFT